MGFTTLLAGRLVDHNLFNTYSNDSFSFLLNADSHKLHLYTNPCVHVFSDCICCVNCTCSQTQDMEMKLITNYGEGAIFT